jgi:hypothetical protein
VLLLGELIARQGALDLPAPVRDELAARLRQEIALELFRREEVRRVVAALGAAGSPFLLFKGTPLAYSLYPEACLRDRGDTDVLVQSKAAAQEAWGVLQELGYERINTPDGELASYQFPCILRGSPVAEMLDVHWAISNTPALRVLSFAELWAHSIAVPELGPAARAPCLEHALLLACLHRLSHVADGDENKLIWLYDIHLLLETLDDDQWRRFLAAAGEKGIAGACWEGVKCAVACFYTPQGGLRRSEELRQLAALPDQQVAVPGTVLERDIAQLRAATGTGERLRLLREYLVPAAAYMQARYRPRWRWLLPWYYLGRIARGTNRRLRGRRARGR